MIALDCAALVLALLAAYQLCATLLAPRYGGLEPFAHYAWLMWVVVPTWLTALRFVGLCRPATYRSSASMFAALAKAHLIASLVLFATMYLAMRPDVSRSLLQTFIVTGFVLLALEKLAARFMIGWLAPCLRVLVVGQRPAADSCLSVLSAEPHRGIEVVGVIAADESIAGTNATGNGAGTTHEHWSRALGAFSTDEVVAVAPFGKAASFEALADACAERGLVFRMLVTMPRPAVGSYQVEDLGGGACLISLETVPNDALQLTAKRLLDVAGALVGLVLCALVYPWYALQIARESPGPVFFRQQRRGRNGRQFTLYKFRTMHLDAEWRLPELMARNQMNGHMFKLRDDPRVTPTGRFMRRAHLDELPQFWNVLRGEMSLVGTRPPTPAEVAQYRAAHLRRLSIKPGITGLWQISGNGTVSDFEKVVRLDCEYIDNWSLWLDAKILGKTVTKVVTLGGW